MTTTHDQHTGAEPPPVAPWNRLAARIAAAVVAGVAGAASFEHIASVALRAGERTWVAYSLPFAIDGLIVVGVVALLEDQRHHRHGRLSARLAVLVGVVATLAANVASAEPTVTARLVALAAPVSFLLSVEVLTRTGRRLSTPADTTTVDQASTSATAHGRKPAQSPDPQQPKTPPARRRRPNTAARVAHAIAQTPTATPAEIAARLKVSERTVHRYWPDPPSSDSGLRAVPRPGLAPVPATAFTNPNGRAAAKPAEAAQ